jgi:hypothetical protein
VPMRRDVRARVELETEKSNKSDRSLYTVTSRETYSHLMGSTDRVKLDEDGAVDTELERRRHISTVLRCLPLAPGPQGRLSWTNTQYYVYWRLGIKTAGTLNTRPKSVPMRRDVRDRVELGSAGPGVHRGG